MARIAVLALVLATLCGCASRPQRGAVQFFPANNQANTIGLLNGEYITNGVGNGTVSVSDARWFHCDTLTQDRMMSIASFHTVRITDNIRTVQYY
jgi:hypothetical protein